MMTDQEELLKILDAHGKNFLQAFDLPNVRSSGKRKAIDKTSCSSPKRTKHNEDQLDSEEEWGGTQNTNTELTGDDSDSGTSLEISDIDQDDLTTNGSDDKVIYFSEKAFKNEPVSNSQMKAFMSSKISKLRDDSTNISQPSKRTAEGGDDDDERTNAENDALLHKLVHTQLLSGSLDPNLNITPAHRRKALAGRVMELAGEARLGKGEKSVRHIERNKAGKRVREGLALKEKEKEKRELEEAKNLGNYHPALKKLFEGSGVPKSQPRSRGLKMGAGKFRRGVLQLSKQEITAVAGSSRSSANESRKKK